MASSLRPIDSGSAEIRQKRIHIGNEHNYHLFHAFLEMEMLKNLNKKHYEYSCYESILGLHIVVRIYTAIYIVSLRSIEV